MTRICTFIGNSRISITATLKTKLKEQIEKVINQNVSVFYCGGYGDFDMLCAKTLRDLKIKYPNIKSYFITPYITDSYLKKIREYLNDNLYDDTIYPEIENIPPKFAICKRNEYMVNSADIIIAYVYATFGGAYKTLTYAKRKKKEIIFISDI